MEQIVSRQWNPREEVSRCGLTQDKYERLDESASMVTNYLDNAVLLPHKDIKDTQSWHDDKKVGKSMEVFLCYKSFFKKCTNPRGRG